ncbi:MAG: T9SS type A sorting domain-containing protein [Calditrichaeota bacterium]|nr:T9SS type A sorting domain-containing protein [Calditrichota bacterium]MCB9365635.1 T9SS type A sorting domain-containing protein [Calditrichota bacterium]
MYKTLHPMHLLPQWTVRLLVVCLLCSAAPLYADLDTLWTRVYNYGSATRLIACTELAQGGFAAVGYQSTSGDDDGVLLKLSPLGDTLWTRIYGQANVGERLFGVMELDNGTIVACGRANGVLSVRIALFSGSGQLLGEKTYTPPSGSSEAVAMMPADDGGFYVLAQRYVPNNNLDFWLFRCTATGDSLWSFTYGTPTMEIPDNILPGATPGRLELFGASRFASNNLYQFLRIGVSTSGQFLDSATYGDTSLWESMGASMRDSVSGEYVLAGDRWVTSADRNGYAVRLAPQGTIVWEQRFSAGFGSEKVGGVAPYLDGGILFAGWSGPSSGSTALWLRAVSAGGDSLWSWLGDEPGRAFEDLELLSDGGYLICGTAYINGSNKGLVWRLSPPSGVSGVVRDRITQETMVGVQVAALELPQYAVSDSLGRFSLSLPPGVYTLHSGGACFAGDTIHNVEVFSNETSTADLTAGSPTMLVDFTTINVLAQNHEPGFATLPVFNDGSGDLVISFEPETTHPQGDWLTTIPTSAHVAPGETLYVEVQVLADTLDNGTYDYEGLLHMHSNACPETLRTLQVLASILDAEDAAPLPAEFRLFPAYPNPFNSSARLRFSFDHATDVSLVVFDLQGREVATLLASKRMTAGEHELTWNADGLASGLYFARLSDSRRSQTQRLLYLR